MFRRVSVSFCWWLHPKKKKKGPTHWKQDLCVTDSIQTLLQSFPPPCLQLIQRLTHTPRALPHTELHRRHRSITSYLAEEEYGEESILGHLEKITFRISELVCACWFVCSCAALYVIHNGYKNSPKSSGSRKIQRTVIHQQQSASLWHEITLIYYSREFAGRAMVFTTSWKCYRLK